MKFVLAIEKKNRANIGTIKGHNQRLHATKSQLPKEAWLSEKGRHEVMPFNQVLLKEAQNLAKRKDAVLAIELIVQVGNQTDWREIPDSEHPFGKKKTGITKQMNLLIAATKEAAIAEFGKDRIISIDFHTDESTPHAHIVFAPIFNGKLQAKHWLDGATSCAVLREKIHKHINKQLPCDYEKGAPGGEPHDPKKAAGGEKGPQIERKKGFLEKAGDAINSIAEIKQLKTAIESLNQQLQVMFSRLKRAETVAKNEAEKRLEADKKAAAAVLSEQKARREIVLLERKIEALTPKPLAKPEKPSPEGFSGIPARSKATPRKPM